MGKEGRGERVGGPVTTATELARKKKKGGGTASARGVTKVSG